MDQKKKEFLKKLSKAISDHQYIYWNKEARKINLTQEEFKIKYESLNKELKVTENTKTKRYCWINRGSGSWKYDKKGNIEYLYCYENKEYIIYSSNCYDNTKNKHQIAEKGMHLGNGVTENKGGLTEVRIMFKKRTKTTLLKAFGNVEEEFKKYIPKQFFYNKKTLETQYFENASSVDFGSMYPSNMCGILPDSHTAITVDGKLKPTAEYPFAFYPDSGHIAIYKEFDSHEWLFSPLHKYMFRTAENMDKQHLDFLQSPYTLETKTILMKASDYTLEPEYNWAYEQRKVRDDAKAISVMSIGKMHRKNYTKDKYAHLAAVCIARSNNKMLKLISPLPISEIIQICVDGAIYKTDRKLGLDQKGLGIPYQEFYNCKMSYKGMNMYIVEKDNKIIKFKNACCNFFDDGRLINEESVKSLDDINHWRRIETGVEKRIKENQ